MIGGNGEAISASIRKKNNTIMSSSSGDVHLKKKKNGKCESQASQKQNCVGYFLQISHCAGKEENGTPNSFFQSSKGFSPFSNSNVPKRT